MKRIAALLLLVQVVLFSPIATVDAQEQYVWAYSSVDKTQLQPGDMFTVTLSIYSKEVELTHPDLYIRSDPGLGVVGVPRWTAPETMDQLPSTVSLTYMVLSNVPDDGRFLTIDFDVWVGYNHDTTSVHVRSGTKKEPAQQFKLFWPLVATTGTPSSGPQGSD